MTASGAQVANLARQTVGQIDDLRISRKQLSTFRRGQRNGKAVGERHRVLSLEPARKRDRPHESVRFASAIFEQPRRHSTPRETPTQRRSLLGTPDNKVVTIAAVRISSSLI